MTRIAASPDVVSRRRYSSSVTTVSIATSRPEVSAALLENLEREHDFEITSGPVRNPAQLLPLLEQQGPNLLLVEKRLLDRLGTRLTQTIHAEFPDLRVLLICDRVRSGLFEEIVRYRFHGFLLTSHVPDTCVKAIRTVSQGELWLPRALLEKAIFGPEHAADHDDSMGDVESRLTRRESQVVDCVRQGFTNKRIASKLGIKEDTVKKHLHNVYGKLGVRRRTQLMAHHPTRH